jgi:hypothetical protein
MSHWEPYAYAQVTVDGQQRKTYRAEWAFKREFDDELMSNTAFAKYLLGIASDKWFTNRFGVTKFGIEFSNRRKNRAVCSHRLGRFILKFPGNGSMNDRITGLHELMHVVTHRQAHGPIFCAALLQVVIHYMGIVAGQTLQRLYVANLVDFGPRF